MTIAFVAYVLCLATALACAVLLTRACRTAYSSLLFWSACCFWGLSASNALVIFDVLVVPETDLYWMRLATALVSMTMLIYGMVWESS